LTIKDFSPYREIEVIHNFVDPEVYKPGNLYCKMHLTKSENEKVVMHVSNFRKYKNVVAVIDIFEKILNEVPSKLVLVGDGPEMINVREAVFKKKLEKKVHYLGTQSKVECILPGADLFLFPSKEESFGLALLEAMSCGVSFVASNIGGISEVTGNSFQEYLFNPDDIDKMSKCAISLLKDDDLRKEISIHGRKRVIEQFNPAKILNQYNGLYKRLL